MKKTTQKTKAKQTCASLSYPEKAKEKEYFFVLEVLEDDDARLYGPVSSLKAVDEIIEENIKENIELGMSANILIVKQVRAIQATLDAALKIEEKETFNAGYSDEDCDSIYSNPLSKALNGI